MGPEPPQSPVPATQLCGPCTPLGIKPSGLGWLLETLGWPVNHPTGRVSGSGPSPTPHPLLPLEVPSLGCCAGLSPSALA